MDYEKAVKDLAPCGIDCSRCVAYRDGEIVNLSKALKEKLVNFETMAKKMESFAPIFKDYASFLSILDHFTKGNCVGCRNEDTFNMSCSAKSCHKDEGVEFCFQCDKYPCAENNYNDELHKKWRNNNDLMKEIGVVDFLIQSKDKSRY